MKKHKAAIRAALPHTLPILSGYLVLGSAYGILMNSNGISLLWTVFSSIFIYAGSMQFVTVALLATGFDLLGAFMMTLMVNARHIFYGISFLGKYRNMGPIKPYLIFSLTDETFSLLCSLKPPLDIPEKWFYFYISLFNQIYWISGSILGSLLGSLLGFETRGLEFVLTALFVVIFIGQWKTAKNHIPAIIGILSAVICRLIFGATDFIIPSMLLILLSVTLSRGPIERRSLK
ncbi:MAG: branched-chain amino acid ABC transporter permease [Clostridiales bacterium]|jgi:4-azaleucine resistance transporter AzlC|nr:branched-chain amino acid ABC transporter permease [Clostridiales bacterium]